MNQLAHHIKNQHTTMSKTIDESIAELMQELERITAKQKMLLEKYKPLSPIPKYELIATWVNFMTYDNAKDINSNLHYELKKNDATVVAFGTASNEVFEKNDMSGNFVFHIQNPMTRSEVFDLSFSITMNRSTGTDSWMYQPIVSLMFDDGTVLTKKFQIDLIKENESHSFLF